MVFVPFSHDGFVYMKWKVYFQVNANIYFMYIIWDIFAIFVLCSYLKALVTGGYPEVTIHLWLTTIKTFY